MADIAMLVAEEYERRIKMAQQKVGDKGGSNTGLSSLTTGPLYELRVKWVNQTKVHFQGVEHGSQLSRAALDGFFSA